ncbi:DEAD/DEAH box helicase [Nanoarchaeota archaeon]
MTTKAQTKQKYLNTEISNLPTIHDIEPVETKVEEIKQIIEPQLKDFKPRLYQQTIVGSAINYNTLVVLPTGMGKTGIAIMITLQRLKQYPNSKILILAPTKPLVEQHFQTFKKHLTIDEDKFVMFTGAISPDKRQELWKDAKIIFSTPQGLENDIINNRIDLKDISLITFDEAHRATGDYAYVFVASQYYKKARFSKILALTASPGSDLETINEVTQNLKIENVEVRTDKDPDVKPYIQDVKVEWVNLKFPEEFKSTHKYLKDCYKSKLKDIKQYGYINRTDQVSKSEILRLQAQLRAELSSGNKGFEVLKSISLAAEAIKVEHAVELLETQGVEALHNYLEKINTESRTTKVKATANLAKDINFRSALIKTKTLIENNVEHPKLKELKKLLNSETYKNKDAKIIVFTQFRDTGKKIINDIKNLKAEIFVGQAKKNGLGLTQKKQIETLDKFRNGDFNILVATSVAEEGLDIPAVDLVVFYEPIPSAIRSIQRRGRTGRLEKGRVIVFMTKDTRDVGYKWSAHHKEKRMYKNLKELQDKFEVKKISTLNDFTPKYNDVKIYVDHREKGSGVIKELINFDIQLKTQPLNSADYILSTDVGVEFKTSEDFVNSIIDGRLLQQLKLLKQSFSKPLVIIEGNNLYGQRNIHPNAIRGMLSTIMIDYQIPVIQTKDNKETAEFLISIARREQEEGKRDFTLHAPKAKMSEQELQEYIIEALPQVGPNLAKQILIHFKTISNVINATEQQLKEVDGLGDKIAKKLIELFNKEYKYL